MTHVVSTSLSASVTTMISIRCVVSSRNWSRPTRGSWTILLIAPDGTACALAVVRPWVKTADYWGVYFGLTEAIKKRFDEVGISFPFPQQDVHLYNAPAD